MYESGTQQHAADTDVHPYTPDDDDHHSENGLERVITHPIDEADDDLAFIHELDQKMKQIADE